MVPGLTKIDKMAINWLNLRVKYLKNRKNRPQLKKYTSVVPITELNHGRNCFKNV